MQAWSYRFAATIEVGDLTLASSLKAATHLVAGMFPISNGKSRPSALIVVALSLPRVGAT